MWIDVIRQRRSFDISSQQKTRPPLMMIKNGIFWVSSAVDRKRLQLFKIIQNTRFWFQVETCEVPIRFFVFRLKVKMPPRPQWAFMVYFGPFRIHTLVSTTKNRFLFNGHSLGDKRAEDFRHTSPPLSAVYQQPYRP